MVVVLLVVMSTSLGAPELELLLLLNNTIIIYFIFNKLL
jgi:hypothetical protein